MSYQGICRALVVLVDRNAGSLVEEHDIFVLVYHVEMRGDILERNLADRLFEKLLRKEALNSISLCKDGVILGSLSVDLDLLRPYGLV